MAQNMGDCALDVCYLEQIEYLLHMLDERGMKAIDLRALATGVSLGSKELWRFQEIPLVSVDPDPGYVGIDRLGNDSSVACFATMANCHDGHPVLVNIGGLSRFRFKRGGRT